MRCHQFWSHIRAGNLGKVYNADAGFILSPTVTMAADVAFVRTDRVPTGPAHSKMLWLAPDLVVEVVSPSDRRAIVDQKVARWLAAGVRLVWLVNTRHRTATVHAIGQPPRVLGSTDEFEGGDVLPGFRMSVYEFLT
jgi:Uma2 family endonuclease